MNFLRSKLFVALVSLALLTGLAHDSFAFCHTANQVQLLQNSSSPADDGDCECICHQPAPAAVTTAVRATETGFAKICFVFGDDAPPDVLPQGIDHPPPVS